MTAKKRVALVGLGRMGKNHLRVLRETPGFELAAIVDAHAAPPADLGALPLLRTVEDLRKINFDVAVISTPTPTHFDVACALLADGKDLFIEKPIASTFAQARELITSATEKGSKLVVGHVERFNPAVRKLREVISQGLLGTPIHFSFTRVGGYPETETRGNNVLLDLAVHDIDVFRSFVGVVKLEDSMCHATWRPPVFDTAEIFLASATGASASVHVNWITPTKIRSIRVTGTRGVCFVDYILQTCELLGGSLLQPIEPSSVSFDVIQEAYRATDKIQFGVQRVEPLRAQAAQFHQFLTGGDAGELCTGKDALAALLLAERAVQAEAARALPQSLPAGDALASATDEWI
jgi:UDP-N-acetylglucosamine 3-dehydrogenase